MTGGRCAGDAARERKFACHFVGNALELILLDLVFSEDYLARDDQVALDALRGAGIP
jgi:hypothetical protein